MIVAVVLLAVIVLGVVGVTGIAGLVATKKDENKKALDAAKVRLLESERSLNKAESTFRRIVNNPDNSVLEAQIALDDITSYHEKELM